MSDVPIMFFVILLYFAGGTLAMMLHERQRRRQRSLPEREEYLKAAQLEQNVCRVCNSAELSEHGFLRKDDKRRIVTCTQCRTLLYQYHRPDMAGGAGDND